MSDKKLNLNNLKGGFLTYGISTNVLVTLFFISIPLLYIFFILQYVKASLFVYIVSLGLPALLLFLFAFGVNIEKQKIYTFLIPLIKHYLFPNKRKQLAESAVALLIDSIVMNTQTKNIIGIIKVYPKNTSVMGSDSEARYIENLGAGFLNHIIGKNIEIIFRNRSASFTDYKDYIDHYINEHKQNPFLTETTKTHLATHLIELEEILVNKQIDYTYVSSEPGKVGELYKKSIYMPLNYKEVYVEISCKSLGKKDIDLEKMRKEIAFISQLLNACNIKSRPLTTQESENYLEEFVKYNIPA